MQIMREEYLRSKSEFSEVRSFLQATREKLEVSEKQVAAWKDECRLTIVKGHEKEDRFEAELAHMRTEVRLGRKKWSNSVPVHLHVQNQTH